MEHPQLTLARVNGFQQCFYAGLSAIAEATRGQLPEGLVRVSRDWVCRQFLIGDYGLSGLRLYW